MAKFDVMEYLPPPPCWLILDTVESNNEQLTAQFYHLGTPWERMFQWCNVFSGCCKHDAPERMSSERGELPGLHGDGSCR